jgi:hypothetical protein
MRLAVRALPDVDVDVDVEWATDDCIVQMLKYTMLKL